MVGRLHILRECFIEFWPLMVAGGILVVGQGLFSWHVAGLQSQAYERRGVQISQWEVFVGVDPERQMQIRFPDVPETRRIHSN